MRKFLFALAMVLTLGMSDRARGAAPSMFTVQGVLRNNAGQLQSMVLNVTVKFFNAPSGGSPLASYSNNMVQAQNGLFTFNITDGGIGAIVQAQSQLWMEVTVGGFGTFPRTQVTSQLYSISAASADALSSACVGCVADSNIGSVGGGKVTGTVATASNFTGSLAGDVIGTQGGTQVVGLRGQALASGVPTSGQVLQFNGSQWTPSTVVGSGVNTVTASAPLASSGGTTPNISLAGIVPIANGGTGSSTQNFVDLNSAQTIPGSKTFLNDTVISAATGDLKFLGTGFTGTLNAPGSNALLYAVQSSTGTNPSHAFYTQGTLRMFIDQSGLTLNSGQLTLPSPLSIASGGTGSSTETWVDLTNSQTVGGTKTFSNATPIQFGNSSQLKSDQGGSIELGGNNSTAGTGIPYIDFHFGNGFAEDYNVRLINDASQQLTFAGGPAGGGITTFRVSNNTSVTQVGVNGSSSSFIATGTTKLFFATSGGNKASVADDGNVRAVGSFIANTTPDLAETIAASADVGVADVVCVDRRKTESVQRCEAGQRIVGVISDGTSSFLINSHGKRLDEPLTGKPLVLAGRVPVKVSLENGPIQIGDLLTLSSTPGVAMRMTAPGPTVGIALASFDGKRPKTGTVLTFVKVGEGHIADEVRRLQTENAELRARLSRLEQVVERLAATGRASTVQPASYHR